ncbi:MAG: diaminopimelate epimerase [Candidatus Zixiibacteriota bacterium]
MRIRWSKYQALGNDFLVIEASRSRMSRARLGRLARAICDRRYGVGADGIVYLSGSRVADRKFDIFNADGGWAEKSGNGLRIAGVHLATHGSRKRNFAFETANSIDRVRLSGKISGGYVTNAELGTPEFRTKLIPVRTRSKYLINSPLKIGGVELPVTCVAVGNPHTVLVVDDFDFDWQQLGAEIEVARAFPNDTNVEFVKPVNRKKITVVSWERGAGATGSSGTGAAASVAALVMLGIVDRECEVVFEAGSLKINWDGKTDIIDVTGPVIFVAEGTFPFK